MGLILCTKKAEHPFYYETLDKNLWSMQELCYVLLHYPVLLPESIVDEKLCQWLQEELGFSYLAEKLKSYIGQEEKRNLALLRILREGNYCAEWELREYEQRLAAIRVLSPAEFSEKQGDAYLSLKRYRKAAEAYQKAESEEHSPTRKRKLADSYVALTRFHQAGEIYEELYQSEKMKEALKRLYFLGRLEPSENRGRRYAKDFREAGNEAWDRQYAAARKNAENTEKIKRLRALYEKDPKDFCRLAGEEIGRWKAEYRSRN